MKKYILLALTIACSKNMITAEADQNNSSTPSAGTSLWTQMKQRVANARDDFRRNYVFNELTSTNKLNKTLTTKAEEDSKKNPVVKEDLYILSPNNSYAVRENNTNNECYSNAPSKDDYLISDKVAVGVISSVLHSNPKIKHPNGDVYVLHAVTFDKKIHEIHRLIIPSQSYLDKIIADAETSTLLCSHAMTSFKSGTTAALSFLVIHGIRNAVSHVITNGTKNLETSLINSVDSKLLVTTGATFAGVGLATYAGLKLWERSAKAHLLKPLNVYSKRDSR